MFAFGECGFAAEIPAFAGMEGCVELAAAFSFISPTPIPAKAGISLSSNCKKRCGASVARPSKQGDSRLRGNGKEGGRKPESHSRDSENFPRSGTLQCSPSANAASPQRFRLSPEWKEGGGVSLFRSIPVQAKMKTGASIPKICANCYN